MLDECKHWVRGLGLSWSPSHYAKLRYARRRCSGRFQDASRRFSKQRNTSAPRTHTISIINIITTSVTQPSQPSLPSHTRIFCGRSPPGTKHEPTYDQTRKQTDHNDLASYGSSCLVFVTTAAINVLYRAPAESKKTL